MKANIRMGNKLISIGAEGLSDEVQGIGKRIKSGYASKEDLAIGFKLVARTVKYDEMGLLYGY